MHGSLLRRVLLHYVFKFCFCYFSDFYLSGEKKKTFVGFHFQFFIVLFFIFIPLIFIINSETDF